MSIVRVHDAGFIQQVVHEAQPQFDFNAIDWLENENNIALADEGDVCLFDYGYPGLWTGHYFFSKKTRGKAAKTLAREMLREMFINRGARVIRGLTPLPNRAARLMTRYLGFESLGPINTTQGYCELFVLTPDRFFHSILKD